MPRTVMVSDMPPRDTRMPGTSKLSKFCTPMFCSVSPVIAWTEIGTSWSRSVRFCAVTTISSSATSASGLALPWADASEETAINTPARIVAGIFAANAGTSGFFS